jgi:hypothetical protein
MLNLNFKAVPVWTTSAASFCILEVEISFRMLFILIMQHTNFAGGMITWPLLG